MITLEKLEKLGACEEGIEYFNSLRTEDPKTLFEKALNDGEYGYINWLIIELMDKTQALKYAIYAAEQVIHVFEDKYPEDKRPREAIQAAKDYLTNPCKATKKKARAARDAADAVVAAYAAAYAAYAAYAAACVAASAAAHAATYAADAAVYAADAATAAARANGAAAARKEMKIKILRYGFDLIYNN